MKSQPRKTLCFLLIFPLAATGFLWRQDVREQYDVFFHENFQLDSCENHWGISNHWRTRGIRVVGQHGVGGIYFEAGTMGRWGTPEDYTISDWNISSQPFQFQFGVDLTEGRKQDHFEAGVAVVLCPRPPQQMTVDDHSIVIHVNFAGVGMAVWKGWFLNKNAEQVSDSTYDHNKLASVPWHMQYFQSARLDFTVERTATQIRMAVTSSELPEKDVWHEETFDTQDLPADLVVRHVVVQRVPVLPEHFGYPDFRLRGRISHMVGYPTSNAHPSVDRIQTRRISNGRTEIEFRGQNLGEISRVQIGESFSKDIYDQSNSSITAAFSEFRLPAGPHSVVISSGEQFWKLDRTFNVDFGAISWSPREISDDGDTLSIRGIAYGGVEELRINGSPAEVLNVEPNGTVLVRTPPLSKGRHQLKVRVRGKWYELDSPVCVGHHPKLLWTVGSKKQLAEKFSRPDLNSYVQRIRESAAEGDWLSCLLLAELGGDQSVLPKMLEEVREVCIARKAIEFDAAIWGNVAIVYDTLFDRLSAADRDLMRGYLEFSLKSFSLTGDDWFFEAKHNPSNTVAISNAGGGLVALALLGTDPQAAEALDFAHDRLTQFASATIRDDGGYIEGTLYWNYAMTSYLRFLLAYRNRKLSRSNGNLTHRLKRMPAYVKAILGADGAMVTFNDTQPWLTGLPTIAFLGSEFENPFLDRLADHLVDSKAEGTADAFLHRSDRISGGQIPDLPRWSVLPISQLITFRSSNQWLEGASCSIAGTQARLSHHKQQDQAGLIYSADNQPLIIDPGYYQPEATAHTVPLVNGNGPVAGVSSRLIDVRGRGTTQEASFDLTAPYRKNEDCKFIESLVRTVVMHNEDLVVIDSLHSRFPDETFEVTQQIQTACRPQPATISKDEMKFGMTMPEASPRDVMFEGDNWKQEIEGPREFGRSWIFRRKAEKGELSWYTIRASQTYRGSSESIWCLTRSGKSVDVTSRRDAILLKFSDGETARLDRNKGGFVLQNSRSLALTP